MRKVAKLKNDEVVFTEHNHLYVLNGEKPLISGTTFVKKYFNPFEKDRIAGFCAKKYGMTKNAVIAMWEEKGRLASEYGTACHLHAEEVIKTDPLSSPANQREAATFERIDGIIQDLKKHMDFAEPEMIVFSKTYGIAGTIDLPAVSKDRKTVYILDWKTNEKIERKNRYNKFGREPIGHLPDNSFSHYTLQLNLYQFIMDFEGWVPPGTKFERALIHVNDTAFEIIDVPDAQKDIRLLADHYLTTQRGLA